MLGWGYWLSVAGVSRGVRAAYTRELLKGRGDSGKGGGCAWLCRTSLSSVLQSDAVFRMTLDLSVPAGMDSAAKINDAGLLQQLLEESPIARHAVGKGQLSCSLIRDAVTAGLPLDGHTLVGAAERGCEAALNQWHALLSDSPQWCAQEAWVLPVMALRAISARERPAVLPVLRWVFRTATRQVDVSTSDVQLPPLLLTVLAFRCAAFGDFDTFHWLYTDGRQLTKQDIQAYVPVADLNGFRQAMGPFNANGTDHLHFMRTRHDDTAVTHTLMDTAIGCRQKEFVTLLSHSDVSAPLLAFTHFSARLAASNTSLRLLQWLHAHPGCTFNNHQVIIQFLITRKAPRQLSGTAAVTVAQQTLDALKWLRDIGAFEAVTQTDLTIMVVRTAIYAAWPREHYLVKLQWLLREMGAAWPNGGAAHIVRSALLESKAPDLRSVLALVSQLDCPWGPWTSAECEIMRSNAERLIASPSERASLMRRLHELGCPCTCARPDGGSDDNAAAAHGAGGA
eukprot:TRINITY_DN1051_c0_g1_i2.p1 TRINITY_DN1051_c0_g1~~TRINITY_DN1051_c0_g1_i2.p1  ORF type:complete len:509 (+),score=103.11 TRINITY_DN1051_c0_g1_i2:494-2020(+)